MMHTCVMMTNGMGHDFSRVQVGKGRFTCKCRHCFLRGERSFLKRSFLKQLLGKPCSAALHSFVPLPAPVSAPTPDEPESFFIGDTPSAEDDPFGWGGDFDQDHQAVSDQYLPPSPDKRMEYAEMGLRLSGDPACAHTMEEADPQCASNMPDVLCAEVERAGVSQSYIGFCAVEQASEFQDCVGFNDWSPINTLTHLSK